MDRLICHWFALAGAVLILWPTGAVAAQSRDTANPLGRVVIVENERATQSFSPQSLHVRQMVNAGVLRLTGKNSVPEAWAALVSTQDVIGLKVYSSPGSSSGTRPEVVGAVIERLLDAGIPPDNIVIWDRRLSDLRSAGFPELARRYGARLAGSVDSGYDPELFYETALLGRLVYGDLEFGEKGEGVGRKSHVTRILSRQVTRIINIAPLLNHNLAGVSGILYGLTMGSVDNVLRFELDPSRLSTAIPEIYALPELTDQVALNIVDALICQYEGEERSLLHYSTPLNQLWFSHDPVALDVLGLDAIERQRTRLKRTPAKVNRQIYSNAALMELGVASLDEIKIDRITLQ